MKATGIVRRIDELGRIVIPKEIRRTLRIREGEPLEIFTDREGMIILKKYSHVGELSNYAMQYAETLAQSLKCTVCIVDHDQVISAAGSGKKDFVDRYIPKTLENFLETRQLGVYQVNEKGFLSIVDDMKGYRQEVIAPVLSDGDVIGAVILLNKDEKRNFGNVEMKAAEVIAGILGKS